MPKLSKYTKSQAKTKAWNSFSPFMRTLWNKKKCKCYTCDKPLTFKTTQTGHWFPGHNDATYVNEDFVKPQCLQCNYWKGGNYSEFQRKMIKEIGLKAYDDLFIYAKSGVKLTTNDYLELARYYTEKLKDLDK